MKPTRRGERFQEFTEPPEEEIESVLLKNIDGSNPGYAIRNHQSYVHNCLGVSFEDAVRMFNCNINYSGLNHAVTAEGWFKENKV